MLDNINKVQHNIILKYNTINSIFSNPHTLAKNTEIVYVCKLDKYVYI